MSSDLLRCKWTADEPSHTSADSHFKEAFVVAAAATADALGAVALDDEEDAPNTGEEGGDDNIIADGATKKKKNDAKNLIAFEILYVWLAVSR